MKQKLPCVEKKTITLVFLFSEAVSSQKRTRLRKAQKIF